MAHTNSVTKVFQSQLLTGNSFRLLVFGTYLIACSCQFSLARRATAIARSQVADAPLLAINAKLRELLQFIDNAERTNRRRSAVVAINRQHRIFQLSKLWTQN